MLRYIRKLSNEDRIGNKFIFIPKKNKYRLAINVEIIYDRKAKNYKTDR